MTPSGLREKIIVERAGWIRKMIGGIQALPLDSKESFLSDPRPKKCSFCRILPAEGTGSLNGFGQTYLG